MSRRDQLGRKIPIDRILVEQCHTQGSLGEFISCSLGHHNIGSGGKIREAVSAIGVRCHNGGFQQILEGQVQGRHQVHPHLKLQKHRLHPLPLPVNDRLSLTLPNWYIPSTTSRDLLTPLDERPTPSGFFLCPRQKPDPAAYNRHVPHRFPACACFLSAQ